MLHLFVFDTKSGSDIRYLVRHKGTRLLVLMAVTVLVVEAH